MGERKRAKAPNPSPFSFQFFPVCKHKKFFLIFLQFSLDKMGHTVVYLFSLLMESNY